MFCKMKTAKRRVSLRDKRTEEKGRARAIGSSPSLRESGPPITPASLGPGWPESAPS